MGDASRVQLAIQEETAGFGTVPGGNYSLLRFSNENLRHAQDVNESDEIDPTRQPPGSLRVSRSAAGGITSEDSLASVSAISTGTQNGFDLAIEGAMMSSWSTILSIASTTSVTSSGVGLFIVTSSTAGAFASVGLGQWIRSTGYTTNSGALYGHVIQLISSTSLACEGVRVLDDGTVTNNIATESVVSATWTGSMIRIGTTRKSYTIEKGFTDLTTAAYTLFSGMLVGTWDWGVTAQQTIRQTFGFLGRRGETTTASVAGTPRAKWTNDRLTAPFNVLFKMAGAFTAQSTYRIAELSFRLDNRPRVDYEVGSDTPNVGIGTPGLTGAFNVFMDDETLQQYLEDDTTTKLAFMLGHLSSTQRRIVTFYKVRFTGGGGDAAGREQAVTQQLQWAAESVTLLDGTTVVAMQVDRFA